VTGREKILAAFDPAGSMELGVVAAYESLLIRDKFSEITDLPWWDADTSGLAQDFVRATGIEWLLVEPAPSRKERSRRRYEHEPDGVWLVDDAAGTRVLLVEPRPSGGSTAVAESRHGDAADPPATEAAVDRLVPLEQPFDRARFHAEGRHDGAASVRATTDLFLYGHVKSPVWAFYGLFGYEPMMELLAENEELASYAGRRVLHNVVQKIHAIAALGADAVWIEECMTDQISPGLFARVSLPLLQRVVAEVRAAGMRSVYYYCGNPNGRFDEIMAGGADALHFEEGKKGFTIDIDDVARRVDGRCTIFGNLDAIGILEHGSEDGLRSEIRRQLDAGHRNGNRFVMSIGSPVTPGTPVARVRRYTDLVRGLQAG
jgi:uroporphyrinogen-III decarboxylase